MNPLFIDSLVVMIVALPGHRTFLLQKTPSARAIHHMISDQWIRREHIKTSQPNHYGERWRAVASGRKWQAAGSGKRQEVASGGERWRAAAKS